MLRRNFLDKLSTLRRRDFSYLYALLGEATLGLTFLFYVLIARVVGVERYGVFSAAVALGGILGVLIQFGLPVLLTRTIAADTVKGPRKTLIYILVQTLNAIPVFLILPLAIYLLGFSDEGAVLCWLVIPAELFRSVKMSWRSVMKGNGWFKMESIAVFIERSVVVFAALFALFTTRSLIITLVTLIVARLVDNVGIGWYLSRKVRLGLQLSRKIVRDTYRQAAPFAIHGVLWVLYYQVDMIMLKAMATESDVGYYGAAYRVLEILSALPRVVFYVAFTRFAQCHANNPEKMPEKVYEATRMLLLLVLPCLVVAGILQSVIITFMFGNAYASSIVLLAVLLPSLGVKMFSTLSEEYLLATGAEKKLPPLLLAVAVSNIFANLILIPKFGAMGAAIATGLSECVFCLLGMRLVIKSPIHKTGIKLLQLLLPCVAIATAPSLFIAGVSLWLSVGVLVAAVGVVCYLMQKKRFSMSYLVINKRNKQ